MRRAAAMDEDGPRDAAGDRRGTSAHRDEVAEGGARAAARRPVLPHAERVRAPRSRAHLAAGAAARATGLDRVLRRLRRGGGLALLGVLAGAVRGVPRRARRA